MECIKCGKETSGTQMFCSECLEDMANYPVKAGTAIHLPSRPTANERPAPRSRERSMSETISSLRRLIRWLTVTIAILSILLCATAGFLIHTLDKQAAADMIGRNYTTDTSISEP